MQILAGGARRRLVRYGAAGLSALIAVVYLLIGAGLLTVVSGTSEDGSMLVFGASAGGVFLLGAILLGVVDRRWLWTVGAALQLFVIWGYFAVAPQREPAYEPWGILLRVLQLPLLAALVYLAVRAPAGRPASRPSLEQRSMST